MRCRDRQFGNWSTTRSVNDTRDSSSPVWRHRARPAQDRRINKDQGRESTPPSGSFFDWKRVLPHALLSACSINEARNAALMPEKRSEKARKAVQARWRKKAKKGTSK